MVNYCVVKPFTVASADGTKCYNKSAPLNTPDVCNKDYIQINDKCYYQPSINNNTYSLCDSNSIITNDSYCGNKNIVPTNPTCTKNFQNRLKAKQIDQNIPACCDGTFPLNVSYDATGVRQESKCVPINNDICNTYNYTDSNNIKYMASKVTSTNKTGLVNAYCVFTNNKTDLNYTIPNLVKTASKK
jgi:hypothetical protein